IDAAPEESADNVVAAVCAELAGKVPGVEVGYVRRQRRVIRAVPRPLAGPKPQDIARGGVWVATGGVTGIVGVVARELGRRFALKLHLIGRTPAPKPDEAWRHLSASALKELKRVCAQEARRAGRDPAAARHELEKAVAMDAALR